MVPLLLLANLARMVPGATSLTRDWRPPVRRERITRELSQRFVGFLSRRP